MSNVQNPKSNVPLCIETICVRNGKLQNLDAHQERFDRTRLGLWGQDAPILLEQAIILPTWLLPDQTYKCRVTYGLAVEKIEFEKYPVRPVRSLCLVDCGDLDYRYKYADRTALNALFAQRGRADDVLLVRDGLLTDTSYANVALFDGTRWHTPAHPLLEGTQRARLLHEGRLHLADIRVQDLPTFACVRLLNAMLDWEQTESIPISAVIGWDGPTHRGPTGRGPTGR
ncbi:MAG: hypothetical protein EAZ91_17890 [Cytophagales bacterium]|nr:MAG: hypothetical protein EAZ91_17890 [Cytophagales bacterium]